MGGKGVVAICHWFSQLRLFICSDVLPEGGSSLECFLPTTTSYVGGSWRIFCLKTTAWGGLAGFPTCEMPSQRFQVCLKQILFSAKDLWGTWRATRSRNHSSQLVVIPSFQPDTRPVAISGIALFSSGTRKGTSPAGYNSWFRAGELDVISGCDKTR